MALQKDRKLFPWIAAILSVIFCGSIFLLWLWPKSCTLSQSYIARYRGFGLDKQDGWLTGRLYYELEYAPTGPNDGLTTIGARPGYNYFRGYYNNGVLREEGEALIEYIDDCPVMPDSDKIRWAKYYRPDGTLGSEVVDGTGVQTLWTIQGIKVWELKMQKQTRTHLSTWYPNGKLQRSSDFVNGLEDGKFQSFYPNGQIITAGEYKMGYRVGKWNQYDEDGHIIEEK